ncbi:MAG: hypothetical protein IKU27_07085 [Clostridia bacterium]|nr:hypothetical protein [Clostridia bacterium]
MITCAEDILKLIDDWGFVPFFQNEIPGFSIEEHIDPALWFSETRDGPWEWKGPIIRQSGCAYGKFFRNKAVFISPRLFPDFANHRRNGYDLDSRWEEGLASQAEFQVWETLQKYASLLSVDLKEQSGFGKNGRKGFDGVLTRLQMGGYIVTTDFEYRKDKHGNPYGWGVARYALPEQHFGNTFTDAVYLREPEESKTILFDHLRALHPNIPEKTLWKMIG